MSETIRIVPTWNGTGSARGMVRGTDLTPSGSTYSSMIPNITDRLDSTYQVLTATRSARADLAICFESKANFCNQILSALPDNAVNISIKFIARASCPNSTYPGYVRMYNTEAYSSSISFTQLGSIIVRSTSISNRTMLTLNFNTKNDILNYFNNLQYEMIAFVEESPSYKSYSITVYDVWLDITYDLPTGPTIKVKVNGEWEEGELKAKVNGEWVDAEAAYVKVDGAWIEIN